MTRVLEARAWRLVVGRIGGDDGGDDPGGDGAKNEVAVDFTPLVAGRRTAEVIGAVVDALAAVPVLVAHVVATLPVVVADVVVVVAVVVFVASAAVAIVPVVEVLPVFAIVAVVVVTIVLLGEGRERGGAKAEKDQGRGGVLEGFR